jgi:hypothetical protein
LRSTSTFDSLTLLSGHRYTQLTGAKAMDSLKTEEIYEQIVKPMAAAERQRLVEIIVHGLSSAAHEEFLSNYSWASIRGIAPGLSAEQDAQAWVSNSRREADEHRKQQLGNKP